MNHLAKESSPYLLQHANDPVEWYPWGEAALARARREQRPILLSIGYSSCHWCHVMARESFSDPDIAALMNRHFINIKVDREERPDLDRIYQLAHQLIQQRPGGWPLTMFLTAERQVPFFGGTYFPPAAQAGLPSFHDLLERVADFHAHEQQALEQSTTAMQEALAGMVPVPASPGVELDALPLEACRDFLLAEADRDYGGFGGAPKFPHSSLLDRLLRHWRTTAHSSTPDREALLVVALSLKRMIEGGIFDQLGGGFFRYSVDHCWQIPHFEKMLPDNAELLALLARFFQVSGDESFRQAARETASWLLREMHADGGGYCAALDADSDGGEGRCYLWTPAAVSAVVSVEEMAALAPHFGLAGEPNFQDPHSGERAWHLSIRKSAEALAVDLQLPVSTVRKRLFSGRSKLLRAREQRQQPARDDKVLTGWNAQLIRALAIAAPLLEDLTLLDEAAATTDFIRRQLWIDGRLRAGWCAGRASPHAWLDDHALLLDALLELLQRRWDDQHLAFAINIADSLLRHFEDAEGGGFWFTPHDHPHLLQRSKVLADEATPSGNGVAACALNRLGQLLGESRYLVAARRTIELAWPALCQSPQAHPTLLTALAEVLQPPRIVIIRGSGPQAASWAATAHAAYDPGRLVFLIPHDAAALPAALAAHRVGAGETRAFICSGSRCMSTATTPAELMQALAEEPGTEHG